MGLKYFYTTNASRSYRAGGGLVFDFESLTFGGGSWTGTYETENEAHIEALSKFGPPVKEISKTEYDNLKKKPPPSSPASRERQVKEAPPEDAPLVVEKSEDVLSFGEADPTLLDKLEEANTHEPQTV